MYNLIKDTFIYIGTTLISKAIPFLLLPILTRYLSPGDYGYVSTFVLYVSIVSLITQMATHGSVQAYYFSVDENLRAKHFFNTFWIILFFSFFTLIILFLFQKPLVDFTLIKFDWLLLGLLCAMFDSFSMLLMSLLRITREARLYGILEIARTCLNMGLSILLLVHWNSGWQSRVIVIFFTSAVFVSISLFFLFKKKYIAYSFSWKAISEHFSYGFPLLFHGLGAIAVASASRFFLNHHAGLAATGLFSLAFQLASIIDVLAISLNTAILPQLFEKLSRENLDKNKIVRVIYSIFLFYIFSAFLLGTLGMPMLSLFFPKSYSECSQFITLISFGMAFQGMYYLVSNFIFFSKKTKYLGISTGIVSFISVGLNFYFIRKYGAQGAAIALFLSYLIMFLMTWRLSQFCYEMPWFSRESFKWKKWESLYTDFQ